MKAIVLSGIQASGKSTWAKEYCAKNKDYIRVCRDDLRNMRGDYWIPKQENLITQMEDACIDAALSGGYNVIIDAMHLNQDRNKAREAKIKEKYPNTKFEYKTFEITLEEAIKRDLARPNSIGEKVITETYNKYFKKEPMKLKQNDSLIKAIIVDVDGTIAIKGDRSPFDWDRVGEDAPNKPVVNLVKVLAQAGYIIIFVSGRDEVCRFETKQWIEKHIPLKSYYLHMRKEGDMRKDSIIKKEIFDDHIRDNFYVELVLDDRLSICRLWNEMGLTLLRVGDPDVDF